MHNLMCGELNGVKYMLLYLLLPLPGNLHIELYCIELITPDLLDFRNILRMISSMRHSTGKKDQLQVKGSRRQRKQKE